MSENQQNYSIKSARRRSDGQAKKILPMLCAIGITQVALAADQDAAQQLSNVASPIVITAPIVVTGTRQEQNSFDLPMSIDSISADKIQEGQLQANISEDLARVPGITAQSRGQYAQDVQISSRGFGARSQFGVRGIRLYADGIPLTMPDGQGQAGTFDLGSAKRIEVLRGPFSALYGNSSGGVVQIFTEDGPENFTLGGSFAAGSYGTQRSSVKAGGTAEDINYIADYSHLQSDGYRDHSAVRRDLFNTKLGIQFTNDTHVTVIITDLDQPVSQDPLGLTKTQWQNNPRQAGNNANAFNTRVSKSQTQVGVKLDHEIDENNTLSLLGYGGVRENLQYLPTATTAQGIISSGGVSQINRDFGGVDLHFTHKGSFINRPYNISVGSNFDTMTDDRTGYQNFITVGGVNILGVQGALRRNELDTAKDFDQYAQAQWSVLERLDVIAGVRHSRVSINSDDHFIVGANGNDSGNVSFEKTTPVVGTIFKITPSWNVYANAGKGFETPTLIEMAYQPSGASGLNFNLRPATSNNYEIGSKAFITDNTRVNAAFFLTDTSNEIVTATNSGGRTTYQNAGGTRRTGLELSADTIFGRGFTGYAAYTLIDASYSDAFRTCNGAPPCTAATQSIIRAGNAIPGIYRQSTYSEIAWKNTPTGFSTAFEVRANSKIYVNDQNTDHAPAYAVLNWHGGFSQKLQQWKLSEFLRLENILDKNYVGSVRINDANAQYYESGAGSNWLLGLNANYVF